MPSLTEKIPKERVLIVEVNEKSTLLLRSMMEAEGYIVECSMNGIEAMNIVPTFCPDLILLDIMMPGMDGFETCQRLKADVRTRYIPVVMLTARSESDDKVTALNAGAEDYIVKPYSVAELTARVRSILAMRALQKKLTETEKMAALGEMIDGIAHEIRNPLVMIGGMARRLFEHESDDKHKRYAGRIMEGVLRMEHMMERIAEYKGVLVSDFTASNINDPIEAAVEEAKLYIDGKRLKIKTELLKEPPILKLDPKNIKLAIFNILQNAMEAVEEVAGEITLKTELREQRGKEYLIIKITDNGHGIDAELLRNVFHPFHTTKTAGGGLGLNIAYRIIEDNGGTLSVQSKKGEGAEFTINLPVGD
ncbi:MAG: response regulator [Deltaproteobacteria bacterium]|nr:response regulator [Deltaproteobacteria bacterium]